MAITKIKLGTLYQNGIAINYTNSPVLYNSGTLELKSSSSTTDEIIEWVSFVDGAKNLLISTKNVLSNISYTDLQTQALISGNTVITLNSTKYKVRLLTNEDYNKYILNTINLDTLSTPSTQDKTVGGYTDATIISSTSNDVWHWWKQSSLTQDISGSNVTIRGDTAINTTSIIDKSSKNATIGYRIVLDKYNYPPTISDSDSTIGNFTSSVIKKYSITDPDNDLFKVTESLDGVETRVLENQSSKTEFTYSLTGTEWTNVSAGRHVIIIKVQDVYGNIVTRQWIFNKLVETTTEISSSLTRPVIVTPNSALSLNPINSLEDNTINFNVTGGDLFYSHEINIVNNSNQVVVFNQKVEDFTYKNVIPSGTLANGNTYQIKIRTYNSSGQYSGWSDSVLVKALTPAELMFTNIIDGKIATPNPVMIATYSQAEGDTLYSYRFILYKDGAQVDYSEELKDGLLSYQFSGLDNKTNYTIEIVVLTNSGMTCKAQQDFYCVFLQTKLPAVLKLANDKKTGSIAITTDVRQILGRVESGDDVIYIDSEWANLHNTTVIWDAESAFRLDGNWTAKIWARDLEDNDAMLLTFTLEDKSIIIMSRWRNVFYLAKYVSSIKLYELHAKVQGDILATDTLYFFIQNDVDKGLMNFNVRRVTSGRNTWFTASNASDVMPSYASENGFLTNLSDDFKSLFVDNTINNEVVKVYIPTVNELKEANTTSEIGKAVIGQMALGNSNTIQLSDSQSYFTRDIDDTDTLKLKIFNVDGTVGSAYPNEKIGIRFIVKIPNTAKVTVFKDNTDDCYMLSLNVFDLFKVQNISSLNVGDRIKAYAIKYKDKLIKFTILANEGGTMTLLSDAINTSKEFDKEELVYTNGNTDWNLSNIKQWLNSNVKIG